MSTTIIKNRSGICEWTPAEVPFILVCDKHGWTTVSETRTEAEDMAEWPTEWCEDCLYEEMIGEEN